MAVRWTLISPLALVALLALPGSLVGCGVGEVGGAYDDGQGEYRAAAATGIKNVDGTFRRVVIGRMYQKDQWMLPAADGYAPHRYPDRLERRARYVCDALVRLRPTFVASLVRMDATEPVTPEQATIFREVKRCVRAQVGHPVRFDVILNALHYADPSFVRSAAAGAQLLRRRLRELDAQLHPDLWSFDFYTVPFNKTNAKTHYPDAIRAGIEWIHANGQLVGGNVWGNELPAGTDFAMVVDRGDMQHVRDQLAALRRRSNAALLMHIRNDPHKPGSLGLTFVAGSLDARKRIVRRHADRQQAYRYRYMYPLFFPLYEVALRRAYDARQDGNMLGLFENLLEQY